MQTLLDLAVQSTASLTIPTWCRRTIARSWGRMLVLPLLLLLLSVPALAASAQTAVMTPREVVEYALTLEKLESDFYRRAFIEIDRGRLSRMPERAKQALRSYGEDETLHVPDLSAVLKSLGGNPDAITIPTNPNYNAILGRDPFANPQDFLLALQNVEDTGVAAYKGQVQNLLAAGDAAKPVLAGALEIHTIEARHAAGVRYLRQTFYNVNVRPWVRNANEVPYPEARRGSAIPFQDEAFDGYATKEEVLAVVGPILAGK